jgi:Fe-S oxidoreductase
MNNLEIIKEALMENLNKQMMPFPMDKKICSGWTNSLPKNGDTIIYTSCMYQIEPVVPLFNKFLPYLSSLKSLMPLASKLKPSKQQIDRAYLILNKIVDAIKNEGIKPAYFYEDEPYSGAILLEMGFLTEFENYAKKVHKFFKDHGVKRIITLDPHTHNALTRYNDFFNFDIEVINYLEIVKPKKAEGEFTIHDSCLYSRFLNLRDKYRELISSSGIKLIEDDLLTGKETSYCCGGPLAPVDSKVSEEMAKERAKGLRKLSNKLLVTCPICYVTLSPHFEGEVKDIAEVLL